MKYSQIFLLLANTMLLGTIAYSLHRVYGDWNETTAIFTLAALANGLAVLGLFASDGRVQLGTKDCSQQTGLYKKPKTLKDFPDGSFKK